MVAIAEGFSSLTKDMLITSTSRSSAAVPVAESTRLTLQNGITIQQRERKRRRGGQKQNGEVKSKERIEATQRI